MLPNIGDDGPAIYDGRKRGSFFFFAWEPRWRNDFTLGNAYVPTAAERSGNFRDVIPTSSGWLPAAVAAQFGIASTGGDSNIYQQFTLGPGGTLIPIIVPAAAAGQPANQYCPWGWSAAVGVSFNAQGQPYCTGGPLGQATAQINNEANNPALNII